MRAADSENSDIEANDGTRPGQAFLVNNDIKLFQNESNNVKNNNNLSLTDKSYMIIDRRRSDTDAMNSMSDVKLVRQKLLKYAHVKSQDSTDTPPSVNDDGANHVVNGNITSSAATDNRTSLTTAK